MKTTAKSALFRELPSVDEVLRIPGVEALAAGHGIAPVTDAARSVVARLRREIASGLLNQSALQLALTGIQKSRSPCSLTRRNPSWPIPGQERRPTTATS